MLMWMSYVLVTTSYEQAELLLLALLWCAAGLVFVVYLIAVEVHIGAICPVCTLIHLLNITHFTIVAILLRRVLRAKPNMRRQDFVSAAIVSTSSALSFNRTVLIRLRTDSKPWLLRAAVIFIVPTLLVSAVQMQSRSGSNDALAAALRRNDNGAHNASAPMTREENIGALIDCLERRHVRMFGSQFCGHCIHQKEAFEPLRLPVYHECVVLEPVPEKAPKRLTGRYRFVIVFGFLSMRHRR